MKFRAKQWDYYAEALFIEAEVENRRYDAVQHKPNNDKDAMEYAKVEESPDGSPASAANIDDYGDDDKQNEGSLPSTREAVFPESAAAEFPQTNHKVRTILSIVHSTYYYILTTI